MRRVGFVLVLLIAAAIAVEPLIHTHPLTQTSAAPCVVCVSSVAPLVITAPAPSAPLAVVTTHALVPVAGIIDRSAPPLASRAPPAL